MPQISASVSKETIKAIDSLAKKNNYPKLSFSGMVDLLLSTHPEVVTELKRQSKK